MLSAAARCIGPESEVTKNFALRIIAPSSLMLVLPASETAREPDKRATSSPSASSGLPPTMIEGMGRREASRPKYSAGHLLTRVPAEGAMTAYCPHNLYNLWNFTQGRQREYRVGRLAADELGKQEIFFDGVQFSFCPDPIFV